MRMRSALRRCTSLLPLFLLATAVEAGEGRIEINQESVNAAGGFPYSISEPGSYVLTGDLAVPADTDGLILVDEVVLDLNGFSITSTAICGQASCPAGIGSAILPFEIFLGASDSTVRNGVIRGFGSTCVRVVTGTRVEDLTVSDCGGSGIAANERSVVMKNRVFETGGVGIVMAPSTVFAHNTVGRSGLGGGGGTNVSGGRATAGNSCDDGSCSPNGQRRYYVTLRIAEGRSAAALCAPGFRPAKVQEIMAPSALYYDERLGRNQSTNIVPSPWINTGISCGSYTQDSFGGLGMVLDLDIINGGPPLWRFTSAPCANGARPIWCIED